MKTVFFLITAWSLHGVIPVRADVASGTTKVVEHFLGSNHEAYAILRTETEVDPESGVTRTQTWMNEYPKLPAAGKPLKERLSNSASLGNPEINDGWYGFTKDSVIRRTLLADISQPAIGRMGASVDKGPPKVTVHSTEAGPPMTSVMTFYPTRMPIPWSAEKAGRLHCEDYARSVTCGNLTVFTSGIIDNRLFGDVRSKYNERPEYGKLSIEEVADDGNSTFVTVCRTVGDVRNTAILCVPPELSSHLRALMEAEDHYLCTGTFKSRKDAIDCARKLREKADGNAAFQGHEVEIWTGFDMNYCFTIYSVVVSHSMEIVRKREVAKVEEILDVPLTLRSSNRYQIRLLEEFEEVR